MTEGLETNCFLLLDLDPAVADVALIEKAIQAKKILWSRESSQGLKAARSRATRNLSRLGDIRKRMLDDGLRDIEAEEARRKIKEQRRQRLADLVNSIKLLKAGGTCTEADVAQLVKESNGRVSEKEIRKSILAAGLRIDPAGAPSSVPKGKSKPRLDAARMEQLRPALEHLGFADLYGFLGVSRNSSAANLRQRADEMNRELLRVALTDAESNARKELCGHCLALFGSKEQKLLYDNSLVFETLEKLRPRLEMAGRHGILTPDVQEELVRQALELGVGADDARTFIEDVARLRKWALVAAASPVKATLRQCGHCWTVQEQSSQKLCSSCGKPLEMQCPRCARTVSTSDAACGGCGFHTGDWDSISRRLDDAEKQNAAGQLDAAAALLGKLDREWPAWPIVRSRLKALQKRLEERDGDRRRIQECVQKRRLLEGHSQIEAFRRKWGGADIAGFAATVDDGLARAAAKVNEGDRYRRLGKPVEAVACYEEALGICRDFTLAMSGLAAIPPTPPTDLAVTRRQEGFVLRWLGADAAADGYLVVRKEQSAPKNQTDGGWCTKTRELGIEDPSVPEGVAVHYAVFSERKGVVSATALRSGAQLRLASVRNLKARAGDQEVILTWRLPAGATGAEIWYRMGSPPERAGVGQSAETTGEQFHDQGLPNDAARGYLVVPRFSDPQHPGSVLRGPGVVATATPAPIPRPVIDLRATEDAGSVKLTWTPAVGAAQVQIRRLTSPPTHKAGEVLTADQVQAFGTSVLATGPGSAQVKMAGIEEAWFLPVTIKGSVAVAGASISISIVRQVADLAADHDGQDIFLTWTWPNGARRAVVAFRHDHYPTTPTDGLAIRHDVTVDQYRRDGMFTLRRVEKRPHYISVFAVSKDGRLFSKARTVLAQMGRLREFRYRIVRGGGVIGRWLAGSGTAHLEVEGSGRLPALVLVSKRRVVPASPEDGDPVMDVPEMELSGARRLAIPRVANDHDTFAKLFFKDARHADEIKLISAEMSQLRL